MGMNEVGPPPYVHIHFHESTLDMKLNKLSVWVTVRTFNWEYRIRLGILAYTIEFRSPIKTYNLPPLKYQVLPLKLSVSDVADEVCAACLR